jgi:hypothetical protein
MWAATHPNGSWASWVKAPTVVDPTTAAGAASATAASCSASRS